MLSVQNMIVGLLSVFACPAVSQFCEEIMVIDFTVSQQHRRGFFFNAVKEISQIGCQLL